jgi:hypothetical protein
VSDEHIQNTILSRHSSVPTEAILGDRCPTALVLSLQHAAEAPLALTVVYGMRAVNGALVMTVLAAFEAEAEHGTSTEEDSPALFSGSFSASISA